MIAIRPRPALTDTLTELPRAGLEMTRLALSAARLDRRLPRGDGHPVLVLPAYGLGDLGLLPLRGFLSGLGYDAVASELGTNLDRGDLRIRRVEDAARFRAVQSERVIRRVREIHARTGRRVSLVGWSMGGLFAYDAARSAPEAVRHGVTLGSPFGDPRGTALWDVMRWLSGSTVPVEEQDFAPWLFGAAPTGASSMAPVTIVFSPRDGIVGLEAARLDPAAEPASAEGERSRIRYVEVESSHLGFALNVEAYRIVARALAAEPH